jgi:hypothetical protein
MTELAFSLHLGNGVYLNSDGTIHSGPAPETAVYEAPYKLPLDAKATGAVLKDVKKALNDFVEDPDVVAKFVEFGFDMKALKLLAGIAKIAGAIAPMFAVAGFAIDILKVFGLFKEGPSALELLVTQRFDELEKQVHAIAVLIQTHDLRDARQAVASFTSAVRDHVAQLNNANPSLTQLENDRIILQNAHAENVGGIAALLSEPTWLAMFDADEHKYVWPYMAHHMYTMPGGPSAPPAPAPVPPDESLQFDHRLMVPLASFAAESYLAAIRGISPEYRTTGDFRSHLRDFATKVDDLAQNMRATGLGRTVYTAADFSWPVLLHASEVTRFGPLDAPALLTVAPTCSRLPVGSLDLRYHGDSFFKDFRTQLIRGEHFGWPHTTKHGGMNLRWLPPAKLERHMAFAHMEGHGEEKYLILNPEECAEAANAQSAKDYSDLLAVSGYTELLQLAVLFRSESTEPHRSQTVRIATPALTRDPQPGTNVAITSEPVVLTGTITAEARREPQLCRASVAVSTQPTKRARPVEYQVRLRALRSITSTGRWREPDYAEYQYVSYSPDPSDRTFKVLDVQVRDMALSDHLLASGSSPREGTVRTEGVVELAVHDFDWWIPVKPPFSLAIPFEDVVRDLRGMGWTRAAAAGTSGPLERAAEVSLASQAHGAKAGPHAFPTLTNTRPPFAVSTSAHFEDSIPRLSWLDGTQDWEGEHRDPKEATVRLNYRLSWTGDRMQVSLEALAPHRNFVVYLVVEEKLPGSGTVLHTAMPLPFNGQLTYVPQSFFDEESAAFEKAAKIFNEFNTKYSLSTEVGPADPVVGAVRPGDLLTSAGLAKVIASAETHQPELLQAVVEGYQR